MQLTRSAVWKTAACWTLGNNTVAEFQLQLLSIRIRLSQFFNPRLFTSLDNWNRFWKSKPLEDAANVPPK